MLYIILTIIVNIFLKRYIVFISTIPPKINFCLTCNTYIYFAIRNSVFINEIIFSKSILEKFLS